jgi:hypothetical protein
MEAATAEKTGELVDNLRWHADAREAAAYHEAGHAVVAAAVGWDVYQIWTDGGHRRVHRG